METPGKRLDHFIRIILKSSANNFAKKVLGEKGSGQIYKYLKGETPLTPENMNPVTSLYPELNTDWLFDGTGEPLNSPITDKELRTNTNNDNADKDALIKKLTGELQGKDALITELRNLLSEYKDIIAHKDSLINDYKLKIVKGDNN